MLRYRNIIIAVFVFLPLFGFCQSRKYLDYIAQYKMLAINQMRKYKVPASITMAQGLLESGAGTSTLAVKAKNHFGIKCHRDWRGPYILKNDDAPNEKFRVYKSVEESYEDHSLFLVRGQRYASLFKLSITDYKGWAYGLKAAGYATSPTYAVNLIQIIENYNLAELDRQAMSKHYLKRYSENTATTSIQIVPPSQSFVGGSHAIAMNNKNYYVIANAGDTYKSLAKEFETSERKLRKYNEVDKRYELKPGDIVYLQKKQTKAHKIFKKKYHQLQVGESLYMVSQKYGMRLKTLYKLNGFDLNHTPIVGERIRLR
ncbi:MAG: glucosaminidase domain-containing protein [Bacteroidaceae bacterium]